MVLPIDYTMNVLNPFEAALGGFQAGQSIRANEQGMQQTAQAMEIAQAQEGRAAQSFGMDMRAAEAAQARAMEMQSALAQLAEKPDATARDYEQVLLAFPEISDELTPAFERLSEEQRRSTVNEVTQLYSAVNAGRADIAQDLLEQRLRAAENAGDTQAAQAARINLEILKTNPEAFKTTLGLELKAVGGNEFDGLLGGSDDRTATMKEYDAAVEQGYEGTFLEYQAEVAEAKRPQTTVNVGKGEGAFQEATGKALAAEAADIVTQGAQAQRALGNINTLEAALRDSPQGAGATLVNFASNLGIKTEGSSNLEVANAIISQLVPQQRPPGSGVMSDADLELFKQSLPRLINTREGNQKIIDTIRAIAEYDIERGRIARRLQLGEITQREAFDQYAALGNPVADFVTGRAVERSTPPVPGIGAERRGARSGADLSEIERGIMELERMLGGAQ